MVIGTILVNQETVNMNIQMVMIMNKFVLMCLEVNVLDVLITKNEQEHKANGYARDFKINSITYNLQSFLGI